MINGLDKQELEEMLRDVRKAYRLLYLYQDRVLHTVRFIGERLGFDYQGGYPWFSANSPAEGKGNLECWAWDWLNMYYYEFRFWDKYVDGQSLRFAVVLQSDTGFQDSTAEEGIQVEQFLSADQSQSRLRLLVGKEAWCDDFEADFGPTASAAYTGLFCGQKTNGAGVFLAKSYPLAAFLDESTTRQALDDFVALCCQHGVSEMRPV